MNRFRSTLAAILAAGGISGAQAALPQDVERDDASAVRRTIESKEATPDTRVTAAGYGEPGIPILALAARDGSVKVVELLVALKADLNATTPVGETALMLASFVPDEAPAVGAPATRTRFDIVRVLVEAGAALENPGRLSAVSYAAYAGNLDILRYLLDRGASPDGGVIEGPAAPPTPLAMAVMQGRGQAARLLLERGANPRLRSPAGDDALALARKFNRADLVPALECAVALAPGAKFAEGCAGK